MFREMRRGKQQLTQAEAVEILKSASSGVLALAGDDGYPYALPMSFVYSEGKLYFHSALTGHKIDAVRRQEKASFCVIAQDQVIPEKYTTAFKSVIAFGRVRIMEDDAEKRSAAMLIAGKYNPGHPMEAQAEIDGGAERMVILELSIEHFTGKEGIELTRQRKNG